MEVTLKNYYVRTVAAVFADYSRIWVGNRYNTIYNCVIVDMKIKGKKRTANMPFIKVLMANVNCRSNSTRGVRNPWWRNPCQTTRSYLCLYTLEIVFFYIPSTNYRRNQYLSISQILLASKLNMLRYFIHIRNNLKE